MNPENSTIDPAPSGLEWTGERYLPEIVGEMALEHLHRYAMAKELACGKTVLDIASGEGYGSRLLSEVASHVYGVDLSAEAVEHANQKYGRPNLEFRVGSCAAIPMADHSVDIVVSFETIEHHDQHEKMMWEIKRVLRPGGVAIISSPEKHEYSIVPNFTNEYHVLELYRHEFESLLAKYFKSIAMYGQRIVYGSGIFLENRAGPSGSYRKEDFASGPTTGLCKPLYLIALASDGDLPAPNSGIFEGDIKQSEALRHLSLTLAEREKNIKTLNEKIAKLMDSHSWKITAPLRFAQEQIITPSLSYLRQALGIAVGGGKRKTPPAE
jgi:SAM-dependent methyltransferase